MTKKGFMEYLSRTADVMLQDLLDAFGAVLIEGPKWCGKTTTAEQAAKSAIRIHFAPDVFFSARHCSPAFWRNFFVRTGMEIKIAA